MLTAYQKSALLSRQHTGIIQTTALSLFLHYFLFAFRHCCALLTPLRCIWGPRLPTDGSWLCKAKPELSEQALHHLPLRGCRPPRSGRCGLSQDEQWEAGRRLHHPVIMFLSEDDCLDVLILYVPAEEHILVGLLFSAINLTAACYLINAYIIPMLQLRKNHYNPYLTVR